MQRCIMLQGRGLPGLDARTGGRNYPRAKDQQLGDRFRSRWQLQFAHFLSTLKDPNSRRCPGAPCCQNLAFPNCGCGYRIRRLWGGDEEQMQSAFEVIRLEAPADARRDLERLLAQRKRSERNCSRRDEAYSLSRLLEPSYGVVDIP
jgi:hypothetical protein